MVREAELLTQDPKFKGYIHDVGGPSANFRHTSCAQQKRRGMCKGRSCLAPEPCRNLDADHSEYTALLQRLRRVDGVKKVFVRSGIRYDYLLQDKNQDFFRELVDYHISGQLKVAPEHCVASVLDYMGKPHFDVFERFWRQYQKLNEKEGKRAVSGAVPHVLSPRLHAGGFRPAGGVSAPHRPPAPAGAGLLSHPRHPFHLYVLYRHRSTGYDAGVCGP